MRDAGIGLASKLVLENKYDQAKDVFTKLLNLRPDDFEIMALHANVFIVEGKLLEAENRLNHVLALNPNYPLGLYFLGVVYHDKGEYEKAIHSYETALKHFPEKDKKDIADVYQNLGCSLWEVRRREEALDAWKTCLKYNPKQKYARENLKEFTNEYGMGKSPVGMDDFWAFVDIKRFILAPTLDPMDAVFLSILVEQEKEINSLRQSLQILPILSTLVMTLYSLTEIF
ncbi:MAG: hypothetical protein A2W22_01760 [Candidatus Levybacteria bacterium RBG_16_35_11]|nr:MAG: hypothetical protein A2W22_01760 [Candidatus Levybacteria bacterium RBG_16_35_11]